MGSAAAPWRATDSLLSVIATTRAPRSQLAMGPTASYAMSIAKHPDPIGAGLAEEALVEAAGPDCLVPGLATPVRIGGIQVWPLPMFEHGSKGFSFKGLEPIGRELKTISKFAEKAIDLMNAPFGK